MSVFPNGSIAVYVTSVSPIKNSSPGVWSDTIDTLPLLSVTDGFTHITSEDLVRLVPTSMVTLPVVLNITGCS